MGCLSCEGQRGCWRATVARRHLLAVREHAAFSQTAKGQTSNQNLRLLNKTQGSLCVISVLTCSSKPLSRFQFTPSTPKQTNHLGFSHLCAFDTWSMHANTKHEIHTHKPYFSYLSLYRIYHNFKLQAMHDFWPQ